jgi:hypothetical protein
MTIRRMPTVKSPDTSKRMARIVGGPETDMHRRAQHVHVKQIPLDLGPLPSLVPELALRAAYRRLEFSSRLTFEQVMANRALAISIRNLADAIARRFSYTAYPNH